MKLDDSQRRTLISLACAVAWADGVVREEEREFVHLMVDRFAAGSIGKHEVENWLDNGPPKASLSELPEEMGELFFYEAMRLAEADGEIADSELELLEKIMARVFKKHPGPISIAKIGLVKQPG